MSKVIEVDIALSVLDHQLVDGGGHNCGKVDDLEIADERLGAERLRPRDCRHGHASG